MSVICLPGIETDEVTVTSGLGNAQPEFIMDLIEKETYQLLDLCQKKEKDMQSLFLNSILNVYTQKLDVTSLPVFPETEPHYIDALMINNPTDDFLNITTSGEKVCKVFVKELETYSESSEESISRDEQREKNIYVSREDIFHPIHYKIYKDHFRRIIPSLKALLIVFPIYKQIHPISDMIIRSFSRPDIEFLRISGDSTIDPSHINAYYTMLVQIKYFIKEYHRQTSCDFIANEATNLALYSVFVLHITGEPESYAGVKTLHISNTCFRQIIIDLSVFNESILTEIIIEQNYSLRRVLIVVPDTFQPANIPSIETDELNANAIFECITKSSFNQINN
ncbi:hypothetical protein NEHOM01_2061 [Nematocida homosporus]|uniref:uncharacterized protein n=1 Tax=Nematocida homosporus TaxID=1912981 RepID=UPI00221EDCA4|nr:uncharacterized protein NEHOM01_2061 [Nematocida homosporus]KAI5187276.1 hypothetical protein NEHOM01_2061 [Nematocida homosporus]